MITKNDDVLLTLLRKNARASISDLAKQLGLSRTTVQKRIAKLQDSGVIAGYRVALGEAYTSRLASAHVSIKIDPKQSTSVVRSLEKISQVTSLYAINGEYDFIAMIRANSLSELSQHLDQIGLLKGVVRTHSAVLLETKFKR